MIDNPPFERFARDFTVEGHPYFDGGELFTARAPGRLDVMGGIADYSGSLVLEMPIAEAAYAAAQVDREPVVRVVSLRAKGEDSFSMPLADFKADGGPAAPRLIDYAQAIRYFQREPGTHWAAYIAGAFLVLMREKEVDFDRGARILIRSDVPEGAGVSSSAAVEVAAMSAIARAYGIALEPSELARLCQVVENRVAGAPCGIMDQMTAVHGRAGKLLALRCQPAEIRGFVDIPEGLRFWGIYSGLRHAVSGSDYGAVRVGAFIADPKGLEDLWGLLDDLIWLYALESTHG